jgi:hypothetical protein
VRCVHFLLYRQAQKAQKAQAAKAKAAKEAKEAKEAKKAKEAKQAEEDVKPPARSNHRNSLDLIRASIAENKANVVEKRREETNRRDLRHRDRTSAAPDIVGSSNVPDAVEPSKRRKRKVPNLKSWGFWEQDPESDPDLSVLKSKAGERSKKTVTPRNPITEETDGDEPFAFHEQVLESRMIRGGKREYKVRWKEYVESF